MPDREADWDLDRLRGIADGATVRCEGDPQSVERAMAVLGAVAVPDTNPTPLISRLGAFHGPDRDDLVETWRAAVDQPGTLTQAEGRRLLDDRWVRHQFRFVNLVDDELHVMVALITDLGPVPESEIPGSSPLDPGPGTPASWTFATLSLEGLVTSAAGTTVELLGCRAEDLIGTRILRFVHPDDRTAIGSLAAITVGTPGVARSLVHRIARPDGSEVWVESTTTFDADRGELQALLSDITVRRAQEAALEASRDEIRQLAEDFRLLAQEIPSGVFRADASGQIRFANARFRALAGERDVESLVDLAFDPDRPLIERAIASAVASAASGEDDTGEPVPVEFRSADQSGTLQLRLTATNGSATAGVARATALVGLLVDATPTLELRARARTDDLTGLLNRSALDDHLATTLAETAPVALLFVDLDRFKFVNDAHGHHAGDEVLRAVAQRLRNTVRSTDELARYGGDEFVIVCRSDDPRVLDAVTARVTATFAEPIRFDGGMWLPAASIGVAIARPDDDPGSLLQRADKAMYRAKADRAAATPLPDENAV